MLSERLRIAFGLIVFSWLTAVPLQAQDGMAGASPWSTLSPWSSYSTPMTPSPWPSAPAQRGSQFGSYWPGQPGYIMPYGQQPQDAQQAPHSGQLPLCLNTQDAYSLQPDLTGFWQGSGGESVEIKRNYARIWGGEAKPCNCVFFLVGQRLIAYSPDTDVVRKYWFQRGGSNQFTLIDESGNLMTYQRTR